VCFFLFFPQSVSETFLITRRILQYVTINLRRPSCEVPRYSCQILITFEFSGRIFEKYSNTKFRENPSSGSRAVPRGQRDRQNMTKLAVAFRNSVQASKKSNKKLW